MFYIREDETPQDLIQFFDKYEISAFGHATSGNSMVYHYKDWKREYLTFKALQSGTFKFSAATSSSKVQYSLDEGTTWVELNHNTNTPTVNSGEKIIWKASGITPQNTTGIGTFSSTGDYEAMGNVMSMAFGDNFRGAKQLQEIYQFAYLFRDSTGLVNAANLRLPATTLSYTCYSNMFKGCTSLITAPKLPATAMAPYCYTYMFDGCQSLTKAPELPAMTLAQNCYAYMFRDCFLLSSPPSRLPATTMAPNCYQTMFCRCYSLTSVPSDYLPSTTLANTCYGSMFAQCSGLTSAPALPATSLTPSCYNNMFSGCTSLGTAPALPATTIASSCYGGMFNGCTTLTSAPALPAITLAEGCYNDMFNGCTGLTTAPALPATALTEGCYQGMFINCRSLDTPPQLPATTLAISCYTNMFLTCLSLQVAPTLPASTLVGSCYQGMFQGCRSLTSITCLATDSSATDCTSDWVNSVAAMGIFTKDASMNRWTTGTNGIPIGWTVVDSGSSQSSLVMWVDDDREDEKNPEWMEFEADSPDDPDAGAYCYRYTGEMIEYDGSEYYVWELMNDSSSDAQDHVAYMLTDTDDYQELNELSVYYDSGNRYNPAIGYLDSDQEAAYTQGDKSEKVLLRVQYQ